MIPLVILRGIQKAVTVAQTVYDVGVAVKEMWQGRDEEPPQPLTYKNVEHIRRQVNAATTGQNRRGTTHAPGKSPDKPR